MFRSIRSRLALSFAGIALIAAVVLGAVLLAILRDYFQSQELGYLGGNAQSIGKVVFSMISAHAPHDEVQAQIKSLAFLSQARIDLYDPSGQLIYDSGSPQNAKVNLGLANQVLVQDNSSPSKDMVFITVGNAKSAPVPPDLSAAPFPPGAGSKGVFVYRSVQAGSSPFGFQITLNGDSSASLPRSNLSILTRLRDPQSEQVLGSIQLSEGPAYGATVLDSVARGWMLASAVAVLLAAALGWLISRRISAPVLALTRTTTRMANGDLTSRVNVKAQDEFGQLGRSFNEMADQVEATVTTLRQFVSDAAHELRTPLTALRTNLDLALGEKDAGEREVFLGRAQAMVRRLEELNSNLLDLSRLEANGHPARDTVDLADLLRQRVEIYASQAEQAGLSFDANIPGTPVPIQADANQITRAMDNLFENACKFTPSGGKVRVVLSDQQGQIVFSVADSGIGIPADDLPQVFNRFHRARNTNAFPGSGLGLAIVKAIVSAHGGTVEAESAGEGKGSKFSIRLSGVSAQNP